MTEWRMADIVSQGQRLDQILVESQRPAERAGGEFTSSVCVRRLR